MVDNLETNLTNPRTPAERKVRELGPWFHNLHLPDGTQTAPDHPLGDFPAFKWEHLGPHIPEDLSGWTALDIGCNAGFYAFELARRGASVTAIDMDEHYLEQARWASGQYSLENRVTFQQKQVYELSQYEQAYDIVCFLGVFYHLRYPLLALDIAAHKTKRLMAFQTLTMPGASKGPSSIDRSLDDREELLQTDWPKMAFIERRMAGDPTNWWVTNATAVKAMLRSTGLRVTEQPGHELYVCIPDKNASDAEARPFARGQFDSVTALARPPGD